MPCSRPNFRYFPSVIRSNWAAEGRRSGGFAAGIAELSFATLIPVTCPGARRNKSLEPTAVFKLHPPARGFCLNILAAQLRD